MTLRSFTEKYNHVLDGMQNQAPSEAIILPVVTVAVWNGEESRVKHAEVHCEGRNVVVAVIMLSAASVYTLKHTCMCSITPFYTGYFW